jgi:GMP synthase (glutamine-hydrolysing)
VTPTSRDDRVVVLRHQPDAGPGNLADWLTTHGHRMDLIDVPDHLPAPAACRAVVVLGSRESVAGHTAEWITPEKRYLRACADAGIPILGICFGAQLLADVLGGRVERMDDPELGWITVEGSSPVAARWFSWHQDRLTPPPGAQPLGRSARCLQAFSLGSHLGVQFHPETTATTVHDWMSQPGRRERYHATGASPGDLLAESHRELPAALLNAHRLYSSFFDALT